VLKEKARSAANAIVAPRIVNGQRPGAGWTEGLVDTPEKARAWVRLVRGDVMRLRNDRLDPRYSLPSGTTSR
jgi:hypothetical protein